MRPTTISFKALIYLFILLAKYCLGQIGSNEVDLTLPRASRGGSVNMDPMDKLFRLGMHIVLLLGAVIEFREDCTTFPPSWVVPLDRAVWDGSNFALFHSEDLWIKTFETQTAELSALSKDEVNIVKDTSKESGTMRQLNWQVATVNPSDCDLLAEIGSNCKQHMTDVVTEMKSVMERCNLQARAEGRATRATVHQAEAHETSECKEQLSDLNRPILRTMTVPATPSSAIASATA
jgi:hypothetical protein